MKDIAIHSQEKDIREDLPWKQINTDILRSLDNPRRGYWYSIIVCLVLLGIFGTLLFFMLDYAERLCLPWHVSQRGRHGASD